MYIFISGTKLLLTLLSAKREMINKVIAVFNSVKITLFIRLSLYPLKFGEFYFHIDRNVVRVGEVVVDDDILGILLVAILLSQPFIHHRFLLFHKLRPFARRNCENDFCRRGDGSIGFTYFDRCHIKVVFNVPC